MKFQETNISYWLRCHKDTDPRSDTGFIKQMVEEAQIILVDKDVDFEYFEPPVLIPEMSNVITTNDTDTSYLVLPFPSIIVEQTDRDIMMYQNADGADNNYHVPFAMYAQVGNHVEVTYMLTPEGEMRGKLWKFEHNEELFPADIGIINALNSRSVGLATCNYSKQNKHTGEVAIKKIVYCASVAKLAKSKLNIDRKAFNYSHEFDVRGHWRKVSRVGKNHLGDYCIKGATWVSNFRKGSGEYIKKSRIFI